MQLQRLTLLAAVCSAVELTITTRTGTFSGNLNDTYPDVRQFKWVPYAKVRKSMSLASQQQASRILCSLQSGTNDGRLQSA